MLRLIWKSLKGKDAKEIDAKMIRLYLKSLKEKVKNRKRAKDRKDRHQAIQEEHTY